MTVYQDKQTVQGVIWQPGVQLPNSGQVDFAPSNTAHGTFPAHTLVVLGMGGYRVVMAGDLVVYADQFSHPIGVIDALTVAMRYQVKTV